SSISPEQYSPARDFAFVPDGTGLYPAVAYFSPPTIETLGNRPALVTVECSSAQRTSGGTQVTCSSPLLRSSLAIASHAACTTRGGLSTPARMSPAWTAKMGRDSPLARERSMPSTSRAHSVDSTVQALQVASNSAWKRATRF